MTSTLDSNKISQLTSPSFNMDKTQESINVKDDEAYQHYLSAVEASKSLRVNIHRLAALLPRHSTLQDEMARLVRACEENIDAQDASHADLVDRIPPSSRKSPDASNLAVKVFGTPEVLEHMLEFLPPYDLLWAYKIDRTFHNTIESSIRLQRRLGIAPDPGSYFFAPCESLANRAKTVYITDSVRRFHGEPNTSREFKPLLFVEIAYFRPDHTPLLPTLGSRTARMLISQPPIYKMQVWAHCCGSPGMLAGGSGGGLRPNRTIESTAGITIGQVIDAASQVRNEHRLCPNATDDLYVKDGFVRCTASVQGPLMLRADDPMLPAQQERLRENFEHWERRDAFRARIGPYQRAKRAARDNGNPIPTLAEFEQAQAEQH